MNVIAPKLQHGKVYEGNAKLVNNLETVRVRVAQRILGCPKRTSDTALRAEVEFSPLETEIWENLNANIA